jgi:excisionase family DNA binding protein
LRLAALYTVAEVAKYLRLSSRTVWTLVAKNRLRSIRPCPRRVLVDEVDLVAYVDRCRSRGRKRRRQRSRRRRALR